MVARDDGVCVPARKAVCMTGAAMGCQALRSEVFQPCHEHIPVQVFLAKCEEQACGESDVCEIISAYAFHCKKSGICVDWRSPHLCRKSISDVQINADVSWSLKPKIKLIMCYSIPVPRLHGV